MKKTLLVLALLLASGSPLPAQVLQLAAEVRSGPANSTPMWMTPYNGRLYFFADDGYNGREFWSSDGITAATMVADINPGLASACYTTYYPTYNQKMAVFNGKLYFPAGANATGEELYKYDGTAAPSLAAEIEPGIAPSYPRYLTVLGNKMYFNANTSDHGVAFYSYDGQNQPVRHDINTGSLTQGTGDIIAYKNKVYFSGYSNATNSEFWCYDPVTDSTHLVSDINPGTDPSTPTSFTIIDSTLYFAASTTTRGRELYSYDGSTLTRLTDVCPGSGDGLYNTIGAVGDTIFFSGSADGVGYDLYTYEVATGVTTMVFTNPQHSSFYPFNYKAYKSQMYFSASSTSLGTEVWKSNGTTTTLVAAMTPGVSSSGPSDYVVWNDDLYLNASLPATGYELYRLQDATGVPSAAFDGGLIVYPNPAKASASLDITLKAAQEIGITLQDAAGMVVYSVAPARYEAGKNMMSLPLQSLTAGSYIYSLRNADGGLLKSGKLVKE